MNSKVIFWKRVFSLVLAIAIILSSAPFCVNADEYDGNTPISYDNSKIESLENDIDNDIVDDENINVGAEENENTDEVEEKNNDDNIKIDENAGFSSDANTDKKSAPGHTDNDFMPLVVSNKSDISCYLLENITLEVTAKASVEGRLSYQWYEINGNEEVVLEGENQVSYNPKTDVVGTRCYFCKVINTVDGADYCGTSDVVMVEVLPTDLVEALADSDITDDGLLTDYTPSIMTEPEDAACAQNEEVTLRVVATGAGTLTYQWYEVSGETKTAIDGATEAEYHPSTAEVGEKSYCCVVTNTVDGTAYTATSREAKVTVSKRKIEIVADMKIVAGTYSSTNSEWYRDALNGEFSRGKTDYDIRITDEGYKIFFSLSEAAKGSEVHYEISYNGSVGTGRGDTGILTLAADGMTQPIKFNESAFAIGKKTETSIRVGTLGNDGWDSYETYTFQVEYTRGLQTLSVSANDTSVELTPSNLRLENGFTSEITGEIARGTMSITILAVPNTTLPTAHIGEDLEFDSWSEDEEELELADFIADGSEYAVIPIRLKWRTASGNQEREYTLKLKLVDYTPSITAEPEDTACAQNEEVTLRVVATGAGTLTYQWYEVSGETKTAIDGATEAEYHPSTAEVGEKSYCCVVTNTVDGTAYTAISREAKVRIFAVTPPQFLTQPESVTCNIGDDVTLFVEISEPGAGSAWLQWYKDGEDLRTTSDLIEVDTSKEGTYRYQCDIVWNLDGNIHTIESNVADVSVKNGTADWKNPTPHITRQPQSLTCKKGDTPVLSVEYEIDEAVRGNITYQWYEYDRLIVGATSKDYVPSTATNRGAVCHCRITNTFDGKKYTVKSNNAVVSVKLTYINTPKTVKDFGSYAKPAPKSDEIITYKTEYDSGEVPAYAYLRFLEEDEDIDFRFTVYHNTVNSIEGAEEEDDVSVYSTSQWAEENGDVFEYYVAFNKGYDTGEHYFFCEVTAYVRNSKNVTEKKLLMGPVKLTFKEASIGFDGTGSSEDPYKLKTPEDLTKLEKLVAEGKSFAGKHFQVVNDITLPDSWTPIGCTKDGGTNINNGANLNAFSGTIDGKMDNGENAKITVPAGGLPLLGYINGATVRNLNIYGERIAGAGLVNNYTGAGLSGNAITIENVRLLSGSQTLKSGLIASCGGNGYACASAGFVVTIRDCVIESGVIVGYEGNESQIGSFAGRINGTIENCTSSATVKGGSYVGGIIGTRDNAMAECVVRNSTFHGTVESSGSYAGGIVGGGYDNQTAPNGACPTILACTVDGTVKGNERVGGIFGGDGFVAQTWDNVVGSISANSFTGKVSGSKYVGAIIGYRDSLNRYDNISANTYSAGCGADRGIGFVKYLDTSYSNPTKMNGTIVFSTEGTTKDCPAVEGCAWRADHNRTDDPLGKDADKLCKKIGGSSADPICYELTVSGSYKTVYNLGEELNLNGIKLTATWTNGTTSTISLRDVTISGYDKNAVGNQTVSLTYGAAVAYITVTVKPVSTKITVSVTIKGDSKHGTTSSPHGLARGGLTTWASESGVEADTAETVWDVLQRVGKNHGITFDADSNNSYGTVYIRAVNGLGEFDNGKNSGWMYTVNGTHPEVGVSAKYLKNGDNIVLHYTDDYDYEEGGNKYGQKPSGGTTTGGGSTGGTTTGGTTGGTSMITTADRNKATAVDKLIEKIGTVTKDSGPAIEAARKAYNDLTPTQKRLVTKLKELTDAEKAYAKLTATAEDQQKARDVMDKISKIGNVTKDSEQDIKDARKAYDALTDQQKLLVDNYETLTAAETKFAMLDTLGKVSDPYINTGDYMEELGTPNVGAIGGEWMVIGLARSGRTVPGVEDYYQKAVEYVQQSIDPDTGRLHKAKSTDNSRMILALTAIGKDVTNVGGYNLLAGLSDLEFVKYQGNNGPIWALLALDSGNYPVPSGGTTTRQALIDEILSVQTSDGGWAISGDRADSDMTGMALTALAPYYKKDPTVKQAIDKAIARLSEMQDDDGGFSTTYGDGKYIATSESTAQVLTALSALGIDADTDSRFVKNGSSVVDALLRYYVKGGGFKHIMDGEIDGMGTEQAYYALTAYYRFLSGKTNLYDMTDIIDMGGDVVTVEPTVPAATEPTEAAQTNIPWWIIAVCIFGGAGWGVVIGIVLVPKLNKKKD